MISKTYYRYIWLLNLLLDNDPLTFEEISVLWEIDTLGEGELPLRTFHEHRKGIKEMFGVDIVCDRSNDFKYSVSNPEVLNQNKLSKWLLSAYRVPDGFATYSRMQDRVFLEEMSKKGSAYVDQIMDALQRDVILVIDYQSIEGPHEVNHISPYALKSYNRQWYLLGYVDEKESIQSILLDSIVDLRLTARTFVRPKNFDARRYCGNTIGGVFVNEELPVVTVRIRVYGAQIEHLRTLPLHRSQEEVKTKYGEYAEFQYRLSITPELISSLLAMGEKVEVLEPGELREEIKERIEKCMSNYLNI